MFRPLKHHQTSAQAYSQSPTLAPDICGVDSSDISVLMAPDEAAIQRQPCTRPFTSARRRCVIKMLVETGSRRVWIRLKRELLTGGGKVCSVIPRDVHVTSMRRLAGPKREYILSRGMVILQGRKI